MNVVRKMPRRFLGVGILILILLILVYIWTRPLSLGLSEPLGEARARWANRPFTAYRLVLEYSALAETSCRQDMVIEAEQVVTVNEHGCPSRPLMTVSGLYAFIDQRATAPIEWPNGYKCNYRALRVSYDPQLGYPLEIKSYLEDYTPGKLGLSLEDLFPSPRICAILGIGWEMVTVKMLQPIT